jgi:spermidine synthase
MLKNKNIIQYITVVVAFCSIIYELLFSQVLTVIFGSSVIMYSLTIGLFLFALGLGSLLFEKFQKRKLEKFFFDVELLLSITGIIGIPFILFVNSFDLNF